MFTIRFLIMAALFGAVVYGDDITLPLDDGSIVISYARFIRDNQPVLFFLIENDTSSSWRTLKLQFDVGGLCNGEPRQWTLPVLTNLAWASQFPLFRKYKETVVSLVGKVDGCRTEIIKATLLFAEGMAGAPSLRDKQVIRIEGVPERVDLSKELQELKVKRDAERSEHKAKRDAEAALQAEEERKATEAAEAFQGRMFRGARAAVGAAEAAAQAEAAQAKKDAAEAARRKQLSAEQRKKDAERDARIAKYRAEEEAKTAEERRKIRAACSAIYQTTADKKLKDLTVKEDQQVRACQALGLYPPQ
jgi:hypothetical protein